jgi:hypothetical protein
VMASETACREGGVRGTRPSASGDVGAISPSSCSRNLDARIIGLWAKKVKGQGINDATGKIDAARRPKAEP